MSDGITSDEGLSEGAASGDDVAGGLGDGWTRVADQDGIPVGTLQGFEIEDERVVIANVDGVLYALEDQCSHADYPLSEGELDGTELECMFHGAKFDVCTGRATQLPAIRPVRTFDVESRDDGVFVHIG